MGGLRRLMTIYSRKISASLFPLWIFWNAFSSSQTRLLNEPHHDVPNHMGFWGPSPHVFWDAILASTSFHPHHVSLSFPCLPYLTHSNIRTLSPQVRMTPTVLSLQVRLRAHGLSQTTRLLAIDNWSVKWISSSCFCTWFGLSTRSQRLPYKE